MKKVRYFVLGLLSLTLLNCSGEDDNGQVVYEGAPALNFLNQGAEQVLYVVSNTAAIETTIKFGTLKGVSGSHTVTLVPDTANSTAVLGTDYEIVSGTDILENGESTGEFVVKFFKDPAIELGKKAVFKLESASLPQAVYNAEHTVNIRLTCPVEVLAGDFESNTYWYNGARKVHNIEQSATGASQITIKNFWEDNINIDPLNTDPKTPDFNLPFNKSNFVISSFGLKFTGRFKYGREITAIPTPNTVSRFNPCTRIVTVYVRYREPNEAGGLNNVDKVETFTGIDIE